jgi:hypothetical protein
LSDQRRIIKGYKLQCELVQEKLEHVISNFEKNKDAIVVEGVHLTPYFMFKVMKKVVPSKGGIFLSTGECSPSLSASAKRASTKNGLP